MFHQIGKAGSLPSPFCPKKTFMQELHGDTTNTGQVKNMLTYFNELSCQTP
jgi:hypothetical protein